MKLSYNYKKRGKKEIKENQFHLVLCFNLFTKILTQNHISLSTTEYTSHNVRKRTFRHVDPAKVQGPVVQGIVSLTSALLIAMI